MKKLFSHDTIPEFPSKKLLPLTTLQLEERRLYLEKYLQSSNLHKNNNKSNHAANFFFILVALDHRISTSTFFHAFLRMAQNETHLSSDDQKIIHIRITLPGEEVISIPVTPIQETSSVIKVTNLSCFT